MTVQELEQCIDTYGSEIYSFCKQMTGSVQEGEELYQDTFMKAMELAAKVDMNNNPKSYLLSIAIRLWKNKKRKVAWRRRIAGEDSLDDENGILEEASNRPQVDSSLSPEDAFLHQEQQDMTDRELDELLQRTLAPVEPRADLNQNLKRKMEDGRMKRLVNMRIFLKISLIDTFQ